MAKIPISTPPEHVGLDLRLPIKSFLGYDINGQLRGNGEIEGLPKL
jgi:hypothetical protein